MKRRQYRITKRIPYKGQWYEPGDIADLPCKFGNLLVTIGKAEKHNPKKVNRKKEKKPADQPPVDATAQPTTDAVVSDAAEPKPQTDEPEPETVSNEAEKSTDEDDDPLISDKLAEEAEAEGIDVRKIRGTGLNGRILRQDLQHYKNRMMRSE